MQNRHDSCRTRESWFFAELQDSNGPGYPGFPVNHVLDTVPVHKQLCRQYPGIFNGIGKLKGVEVKLHIDQSVPPVAQQARQFPFDLCKKVGKEFEHLEQQGIIEKVDGLTLWVSPFTFLFSMNI